MSLLSHNDLISLVEHGVIDAPIENVNGTSIDITLDNILLLEDPTDEAVPINLANKESINLFEHDLYLCAYDLGPDEFILASSAEIFNLPANISAEYKLKSSLARNGLQHLLAGWCDPGWQNSKLTLELKNVTQHHRLVLEPGMKIGQMVFWKSKPVPPNANYSATGQYNNQSSVTSSKGLR